MNAVGTNVLIYMRDPRHEAKRLRAAELVRTLRKGILLCQVACELIATSRKLTSFGYGVAEALHDVAELRRGWRPIRPGWPILNHAHELMKSYSLSFWDATLVATCLDAGVERLYTEDFDAYPTIKRLEIINPFR